MFKQEFMSESKTSAKGSKNFIKFAKLYGDFDLKMVNRRQGFNPKNVTKIDIQPLVLNTLFLRFVVNIEYVDSMDQKKMTAPFELTWYMVKDYIAGYWLDDENYLK